MFERSCAGCHAAEAGAPPMAGPNLHGVLGRRVGGDPDFDYSPALAEAGRRGDSWDAARIQSFLEEPEAMYPGVWMGANGLRAEGERRAIVEFLRQGR